MPNRFAVGFFVFCSAIPIGRCVSAGFGAYSVVGGLQVVEAILHQPFCGEGLELTADQHDVALFGGQFLLRLCMAGTAPAHRAGCDLDQKAGLRARILHKAVQNALGVGFVNILGGMQVAVGAALAPDHRAVADGIAVCLQKACALRARRTAS